MFGNDNAYVLGFMRRVQLGDIREVAQRLTTVALVSLGVLVVALGCGESPEDKALAAAREWTEDSIETISAELGRAIVGEVPLAGSIASSIIEDQLQENIRWTYSTPAKLSQDRYEVKAKAIVEVGIKIPLVTDKSYDVSVSFDLVADTGSGRVVESGIDLLSFGIEEK